MIWVYRVVAIVFLGFGAHFFLGDLPPHDGYMYAGLEFGIGLYYLALPGSLNLINSFLGSRFAFVRWPLVLINIVVVAGHGTIVKDWDANHLSVSALIGSLILLVLSFLLARAWGKAAKEPKEAV